jgi:hydrogenase nickel incorporation protein HypB
MTIPVVRQAPLNPRAAIENRRTFDSAGVICLNLIGATGSGKTALLEAILPRIRTELNVAVIEGDLGPAGDAPRVGSAGVPVVQVLTDSQGQLGAHHVQHALGELSLSKLDLLIVENTGGLVSQASTDLGEHLRVAVLAVSAGHAIAAKYPMALRGAALILLTKYDLLPHVDFDLEGTLRVLGRANPAAEIICTDTRKRVGIDRLAGWLSGYVRAHHFRPPLRPQATESVWLPT